MLFSPQHSGAPSIRSAQVWNAPLLTATNWTSGVGLGVGVDVGCEVGEGSGELVGTGLGLGVAVTVAVDVRSETGVGRGASAGCEPRDKMKTSATAAMTRMTTNKLKERLDILI